jgi:HAD superfamily hydrolase (TIGR01509 family)
METPLIDFRPAGAIFDHDDTLVSNFAPGATIGAHEDSRLKAIYEYADRHNLPTLRSLTPEANMQAFIDAKTSTIEAAISEVFRICGITVEIHPELCEDTVNTIAARKTFFHREFIQTAPEVPGSTDMVISLARNGITRLAIASNAVLSEITDYLDIHQLDRYIFRSRIRSLENARRPKPDPDLYNQAFEALELPETARPHTLAFEDDPRGIRAAHDAGLFVCGVTSRLNCSALLELECPPRLAGNYAELKQQLGLVSS